MRRLQRFQYQVPSPPPFDDHQIVDTGITESRSSKHATKATTYDEDFYLCIHRLTLEARFDIGVINVMREITRNFDVLIVATA